MDLIEVVLSAVAAVAVALAPAARRLLLMGIDVAEQRARLVVQQRLGEAASRVAGVIASEIAAGGTADRHVLDARVEHGAMQLASGFAETVRAHGIEPEVLKGMVAGELGKLGVRVAS